jgi:Flp pilus assembly protein TadG
MGSRLGFVLKRFAAHSGGNIALEFCLAFPILALLLFGLLDLGRFSLQKSAMLQGTQEGANYGVHYPDDSSGINSTAQNATGLTGVTATNSVFCECTAGTTVSCSSTCTGGGILKKYVSVTTTKSFQSVLSSATISFGRFGHWTSPTSLSATVTTIICASPSC